MQKLEQCLNQILSDKIADNIAVKVGKNDNTFCEIYRSNTQTIDAHTLFDMASVTKILATTFLCLIALDRELIDLNTKVSRFFHCEEGKQDMTVSNLLTHTMGIANKPLYRPEVSYDNVAEHILSIPSDVPIGREVLYSCPGFILLGKILEKVFGERLDALLERYVCAPLEMTATGFCPSDKSNIVNSNATNDMLGIVNDYNCRHLGGVTGNAGVFSNMNDLAKYVNMLLSYGEPIISEKTFRNSIKNHTAQMSASRGLGFLYVDDRYEQTGKLFSSGSFGHCGHTGQSIFVDNESGLYVIILSDATITVQKKYGRENYGEVIAMRTAIHNAIAADLRETK